MLIKYEFLKILRKKSTIIRWRRPCNELAAILSAQAEHEKQTRNL